MPLNVHSLYLFNFVFQYILQVSSVRFISFQLQERSVTYLFIYFNVLRLYLFSFHMEKYGKVIYFFDLKALSLWATDQDLKYISVSFPHFACFSYP